MKNKMSKTTITLLACTAAAAFVGSANGGTLSNIGNTWPDSPALETVTNTEDNNGRGVTEARGEFVQSFTTTAAFQIDKIYIEVNGITANVDFQLRIFETSDVTDATNNVGTVVLAPITINTALTANGNVQDVLEIDLVGAEQISLSANQGYGLGLSVVDDGDAGTNLLAFAWRWHDHRGAVPEIYTDGRAFGDGATAEFDFTLAFTAVPEPNSAVSLSDFTYNPADGSSSVSIKGPPNTRYKLVEAADLDFSSPDQNPITLDGATVGTLDSGGVITDSNGDATVQFQLGTGPATFFRAEAF